MCLRHAFAAPRFTIKPFHPPVPARRTGPKGLGTLSEQPAMSCQVEPDWG